MTPRIPDAYTHDTLRALFTRSVKEKFTLGMLEIALELHADAWEASETALKRERVAYLRALMTEGSDIANRVLKVLISLRDEVTPELHDVVALEAEVIAARAERAARLGPYVDADGISWPTRDWR